MRVLRDSIQNVGILVPLTVYRESKTEHYRILDGQRRWMCAKDAGLLHVPVNEVAEPTLVQNIVTMFQIHKLRKDWELMPTALKLELLMQELEEKNESDWRNSQDSMKPLSRGARSFYRMTNATKTRCSIQIPTNA